MLLTPNWREWYHFQHERACHASGAQFEAYVAQCLEKFHDDFINPSPAGTLGDGGCDGIAEAGRILYACYGQRPARNAERELQGKLESDFKRGRDSWDTFEIWRFVTNAPVGPESLKTFTELQRQHLAGTSRPLELRIWSPGSLWDNAVGKLSTEILNELFPGAPGVANVELSDLLPLLDTLDSSDGADDVAAEILPVPSNKMDFNDLPEASRLEFNSGRRMASRIERWYGEASDPSLYDSHGERFKEIYLGIRKVTADPTEILERIYVAVAGPNVRMDAKRANAAYAVVSFFFDGCHIFEMPPTEGEGTDAVAN